MLVRANQPSLQAIGKHLAIISLQALIATIFKDIILSPCHPLCFFIYSATTFSDLALVVLQDGVEVVFAVPLPAAPRGSTAQCSRRPDDASSTFFGSLMIGFPSENDVVEDDLRSALLLTRDIAADHRPPLENLITSIAPMFSNSSHHPEWGNAGGLLRTPPTSSGATLGITNGTAPRYGRESDILGSFDDEDEDTAQDEHGSIVLSPIQYEILDKAVPCTLEFDERVLEVQYRRWRGERMLKVDVMAFTVLLAYHATRQRPLIRADSSPTMMRIVYNIVPCLLIMGPLCLATFRKTQPWYTHRRDYFVGCLYILLMCHYFLIGPFASIRHTLPDYPLDYAPVPLTATETALQLLTSVDGLWMSVLSIILHVRHPWQVLMMGGAVAISLLIAPPICPAMAVTWACWAALAARILVVQLLAPVLVLYFLEYGARKAFCATPFASAWIWRAELRRFPT